MFTIFLLVLLLYVTGCTPKKDTLPLPETESGLRGELGIDKNINEKTIDLYLGREDAVYRDMRMLKDEADYEAIGGDAYLSGYIDGFEVVPYPYLVNVTGLPEAVGDTYSGKTLFHQDENGVYSPNYEESMEILEHFFPKDKIIFLMCGGGGYAGMMKKMLVSLGWDETKIYNTGGYWYYEGEHSVEVKREENGQTFYDFYKVPYHEIDFESLHPLNEEETPEEEKKEERAESLTIPRIENTDGLDEIIYSGNEFLLYIYLPGCTGCAAFTPVLEEFASYRDMDVYEMSFLDIKDTDHTLAKIVDYTPSVFLYRDKGIVAYLDPSRDEDAVFYKNLESFTTWLHRYTDVEVRKGKARNDSGDCGDACRIG